MAKLADLMNVGSREREWNAGPETTEPREENSTQPALNFARELHRLVSPSDGWCSQSHHNRALNEMMGFLNPREVGIRDLLFESNISECMARLIGSTEFGTVPNVRTIVPAERDDPYLHPEPIPTWNLEERIHRLETHVDSVGSATGIDESPDDGSPYVLQTWFKDKLGFERERVRSACRSGHIRWRKLNGRVFCSIPDARAWWVAEQIPDPDPSDSFGLERLEPASGG